VTSEIKNDFVELNLKSLSYNPPVAELSDSSIRLENGVGYVYIQGRLTEVVEVTAVWKEGESPLESSTRTIFIGIG